MTMIAFLPELVLVGGALVLFFLSLAPDAAERARTATWVVAVAALAAALAAFGQRAVLFDGAYQVDALSQWVKLIVAGGFVLVALNGRGAPDIREDIRGEYQLLLTFSVLGLMLLASAIEWVTLVVALELSSFPLYLLVAMRREHPGQRAQMEAALKYLMFGVAANGIMYFGLGTLFGLTGTTSIPLMIERLRPVAGSGLMAVGLGLAFSGVLYKMAVFPFHFWTPDVYQGASNETAGMVATLPKVGAGLVMFRLASLASPESAAVPWLLAMLAGASMLYGNLIALGQTDFKRLLGFSGIAHAGYVLVGFVALDRAGYAAALYYLAGYVLMVLACFTVISRVADGGGNVAIADLAGLHRRSPLLAVTLLAGAFGLAGIPPFAGFMGKLSLFTAALERGHLGLVVFAVINAAIAIYYYLSVVRESVFRDPGERGAIVLDLPTRLLCVLLVAGIVGLGVMPGPVLGGLGNAVQNANALVKRP